MTTWTFLRRALRFVPYNALFFLGAAVSHAQISSLAPPPETEIRAVAYRVLQKASKPGCKVSDCRILVTDFTLPSGQTSPLGMRLADQFSSEIGAQLSGIQIIERSRLRTYLDQERIAPPFLNNEKAIRWLGKQLGATAVLTGTTANESASVRVQVKLFSCDKEKASPVEIFTLPYSDLKAGLNAVDPFTKASSETISSADSGAFRAGVGGISSPVCLHCPNPFYTNTARDARFEGSVLLDVVVSPEGRMSSARIIRGIPFGLNDNAMNTLREWKFKPAMRDGKPVTAKVQIEMTFHLY